jgi:hypothetical protein
MTCLQLAGTGVIGWKITIKKPGYFSITGFKKIFII